MSLIDEALSDSGLSHLYVDISWSEVAKYLTASPGTVQAVAAVAVMALLRRSSRRRTSIASSKTA